MTLPADHLWPQGTYADDDGDLWIGGCSARALAQAYGTPLYVFDEHTLRDRARAYRAALARAYPGPATVAYASKAYLTTALARLWHEEGLHLDVVSGGELYVALQAGFPPDRIHFHGNNKSEAELVEALAAGVGRIVVDNLAELALLERLAASAGRGPVPIWLRLAPGIDAHTHAHIQTGRVDTKFGLSLATGEAEQAVTRAVASPHLLPLGLHAHLGSQIYDPAPLAAAAGRLVALAADMAGRYGFELRELSPGGGWGVPMTVEDPPAPLDAYVAAVAAAVTGACATYRLPLPHLVLEPGRSLVAPAGVALYRVGARKTIPGVRTYVAVDGGMADNIRPALYGAGYTARLLPALEGTDPARRLLETVAVAGRFCESGDILIRDIALPRPEPGDLLAIPMAGAYTLAMASNYNLVPRPAVLFVAGGHARLVQRRERYADLVSRDLDRPPSLGPAFARYQALGNDYIVLDSAGFPDPPTPAFVRLLCDRHHGVGGDGVLWGPLEPSAPFGLRLYNPDGGAFAISGNGLRIFARYLWDRGLPDSRDFVIATPAGPVTAHVLDDAGDRIGLEMGRLSFRSPDIPVAGPVREVVEEPFILDGEQYTITAAGIGNPHCVFFLDEVTPGLAQRIGPRVERHPLFPERTNVQFARVLDRHTLRLEIWERGAGYTLASGTSSCAAAGAALRTGRCDSPVTVLMPGGSLFVDIAANWSVTLTGAVTPICTGVLSPSLCAAAARLTGNAAG